jgi:hypothetical protein
VKGCGRSGVGGVVREFFEWAFVWGDVDPHGGVSQSLKKTFITTVLTAEKKNKQPTHTPGGPGRLRSWSGPVDPEFQGRLRFSYDSMPGQHLGAGPVATERCTAEPGRLPGRRGAWLRMRFWSRVPQLMGGPALGPPIFLNHAASAGVSTAV